MLSIIHVINTENIYNDKSRTKITQHGNLEVVRLYLYPQL